MALSDRENQLLQEMAVGLQRDDPGLADRLGRRVASALPTWLVVVAVALCVPAVVVSVAGCSATVPPLVLGVGQCLFTLAGTLFVAAWAARRTAGRL